MPEAPIPGHPATDQRAASPRWVGLVLFLVLLALLGAGGVRVAAQLSAQGDLREVTAAVAVPRVRTVQPRAVEPRPLTLPGRLQAWAEAPVYARTNGFVARRLADIGDRVTTGQLLAMIETPEVDAQLAAAEAAFATARAQRDLSSRTAQRWNELNERQVVSQQATDERRGDLAARTAQLSQAEAEVNRLRTLSGFKRVMAPFDGIITSRAIDVGGLIVSSSTSSPPLFTVTDMTYLRLYVRVPQAYTGAIRPGVKAGFTVPEYTDRRFVAELTRTAGAVDAQSGSMQVQFTVDNREGSLKPGSYAEVRLELPPEVTAAPQLRVPASALIFRAGGTAIAVVNAEGRVMVKPVRIARDLGAELDIAAGIEPDDQVIDSPSDALRSGDQVQVNKG